MALFAPSRRREVGDRRVRVAEAESTLASLPVNPDVSALVVCVFHFL